MAQRQTVNRRS